MLQIVLDRKKMGKRKDGKDDRFRVDEKEIRNERALVCLRHQSIFILRDFPDVIERSHSVIDTKIDATGI